MTARTTVKKCCVYRCQNIGQVPNLSERRSVIHYFCFAHAEEYEPWAFAWFKLTKKVNNLDGSA
jgi:hypothetical protein